MKITEVSDSSNNAPSKSNTQEETTTRRRPLLEKFNIPVEHLDYDYVKKCSDARTVERILRVLRSGEEGCFPDLEKCAMQRLETLNPESRLLRIETPALRSNELGDAEKEALARGLDEWLSSVSASSSETHEKKLDIFDDEAESADDYENPLENYPLPVRGSSAPAVSQLSRNKFTSNKPTSSQRIKSWEYDKWDKFDVDAELTKLDITDMQVQEWEKREKPKVIEEQKRIQKFMKEGCDNGDDIQCLPKSKIVELSDNEAWNINEIQNEGVDQEEEGTAVNTSKYFKTSVGPTRERKTKIVIDDLHMSV